MILGCLCCPATSVAAESPGPTKLVRFTIQGKTLPLVEANKRVVNGGKKTRPLPDKILKLVPRGMVPPAKDVLSSPSTGVFDLSIEIPITPGLDLSDLRFEVGPSASFTPSGASREWQVNASKDTASMRGLLVLRISSPDEWVSVKYRGATDLAVSHFRVSTPEKLVVTHDGPLQNPDGTVTVVFRAKLSDQDGDPMSGVPILFLASVPDADQQKTWLLTDPNGEAYLPVTSKPSGHALSQIFVNMVKPLTSSVVSVDLSEAHEDIPTLNRKP
jgi:hypothetical protein